MQMHELARQLGIESVDGRPASAFDLEVRGISYDSRRVEVGDLFVAWRGERHDGSSYAPEAARRGAVAVLTPAAESIEVEVPHLVAADPRRLLGPLAARLYGHPDRELLHVGITGTNGKSTVLSLLIAILRASGRPAGQIGTLGYRFGERDFGRGRTTPEGSDYFRLLRSMRDAGAEAVVAEVSSHSLAQGRVAGGRYDLALFTNLTRDHLDFHGDLESYFEAKRRLFGMLSADGRAAIGIGDAFGRRLHSEFPAAVTFDLGDDAAVHPIEIAETIEGIRGVLETPRGALRFAARLIGDYNLKNILAAVAAAEALELEPPAIVEGLAACEPLPGRMELVSSRGGLGALVDFAHTDAALSAALVSARRLLGKAADGGRLIVVFGCGGDRDRGKRQPMGRVAGELADLAIVTSDNPRREDPRQIVADVLPGLEASGGEFLVEVDRRDAIRWAVATAQAGDIVLVAGKGHESTQILGDREIPFSDRQEILVALEERLGPSKVG